MTTIKCASCKRILGGHMHSDFSRINITLFGGRVYRMYCLTCAKEIKDVLKTNKCRLILRKEGLL